VLRKENLKDFAEYSAEQGKEWQGKLTIAIVEFRRGKGRPSDTQSIRKLFF